MDGLNGCSLVRAKMCRDVCFCQFWKVIYLRQDSIGICVPQEIVNLASLQVAKFGQPCQFKH